MGRRGERRNARILRTSDVVGETKTIALHVSRTCWPQVFRICLLSLLLIAALASGAAYASNYIYDSDGRLVAVTDTSGNTVVYNYDAVGNILSIQPIAANQLALFTFNPAQGVVNTVVTLQGNGFSTTLGNNTVKFNGTTATVTSATASQLVVKVPSGATTGPISVKVGTTTISSTTSFIVLPAPTITTFSPIAGNVGATVTISGSNFNPVAGETTVKIGGIAMPIISISNSQIECSVPSIYFSSGPIQVTTPYGQATTSKSFLILPNGFSPTSVVASVPIVANSSAATVNINIADDYGAFTFYATAGQFLSIQISSITTSGSGNVNDYVIGPDDVLQGDTGPGYVSTAGNMSIHINKILQTGYYVVLFGGVGNGTVQLTAKLQTDKQISSNGTGLSVSMPVAAQSDRFIFSGTINQNLGFGLTNLSFAPSSTSSAFVIISNPDGSTLNYQNCPPATSQIGCEFNLQNLPQSGLYAVEIDPPGQYTMGFTGTLSVDTPGTTKKLSLNVPLALTLKYPGQIGAMSFTANTGQTLAIDLSSISTTPVNSILELDVYDPNGKLIYNTGGIGASFGVNMPNLAAGTYTAWVLPEYATPAIMDVTLIPGAAGTLTANGTTASFTTNVPGESYYLTFSANTGESLGLGITNLVFSPASSNDAPYVSVVSPSGSWEIEQSCNPASISPGCSMSLNNLPESGTYSIYIDPTLGFANQQATISFDATLSADIPGVATLLALNTPLALNLQYPGQEGVMSFQATAGQSLLLDATGIVTNPVNQSVALNVYGPNGFPQNEIASNLSSTGGVGVYLPNLTAGTYTVLIDPSYATPSNMAVSLAASSGATVTTDGAAYHFATGQPGQTVQFSFSGVSGQYLGVGITGLGYSSLSTLPASVVIDNPDGTQLTSGSCIPASAAPGCELSLENLPQSGIYTATVTPPVNFFTMRLDVTISQDVPGTGTQLILNNPLALNLQYPGQEGVMSFNASAGENAVLQVSNIVTNPVNQYVDIDVYAPNGSVVASAQTQTAATLNLSSLAAGTYLVFISTVYGTPATMTVELTP